MQYSNISEEQVTTVFIYVFVYSYGLTQKPNKLTEPMLF